MPCEECGRDVVMVYVAGDAECFVVEPLCDSKVPARLGDMTEHECW